MKKILMSGLILVYLTGCLATKTIPTVHSIEGASEVQQVRPSTKGTKHIITPDQVRPSTKGTKHQIQGQWIIPEIVTTKITARNNLANSFNISAISSELTIEQLKAFSSLLNNQIVDIEFSNLSTNFQQETIVNYLIQEVELSKHQFLELTSSDNQIHFSTLISLADAQEQHEIKQDINLTTTAEALGIQKKIKEQNLNLADLSSQDIVKMTNQLPITDTIQNLKDALQHNQPMKEIQIVLNPGENDIKLEQPAEQQYEIKISEGIFSIKDIIIELDQKITWIYIDQQPDILTSREGIFNNQSLTKEQPFTFQFKQRGTFRFKLKNSGDLMTVIVE